jgi:hypothetical protein
MVRGNLMVTTLLLVLLLPFGLTTNGFAFDLTRQHSEEVPNASDVFSNAWVVEARKQLTSDRADNPCFLYITAGTIWILFIAYGILCSGRTSDNHPFPRGFNQNGATRNRFELSLISRWGGRWQFRS